ncbi:hypothetical protein BMF77_01371 [Dolichospermum sp. UHCC 0315A]|jgi:hypothetical protein|nr:hypothetical protein BMF77_01371 [Dolichospermum sp. UHCC 0315A]
MNVVCCQVDFILADIELIRTEFLSFWISLAKYITLIDKIVALLSIFLKNYMKYNYNDADSYYREESGFDSLNY